MKYRSAYMNRETYPNRIRSLSTEQLQQAVSGCVYMRDVLRRLELPTQAYLAQLLQGTLDERGIDTSHLSIGRRADLNGRRFGRLTVLCKGPTLRCGNTTWVCREDETGIEKPVLSKHLLKGATKSFSFGAKRGGTHHQWTGHGQISGSYWGSVQKHANTRKLAFEISIEEAWDLYLKQGRRCALSGEPIYFGESNNCPYTASFDRIDSSKGYVKENVQWVHTRINIMKNRFSEAEFIGFCHKVAATHPACPVR